MKKLKSLFLMCLCLYILAVPTVGVAFDGGPVPPPDDDGSEVYCYWEIHWECWGSLCIPIPVETCCAQ